MDRRRFLRVVGGAAGAVGMQSCTGLRAPSGLSSQGTVTRPPSIRPVLRLGGVGEFGFPSPFASGAGPGYERMIFIYDTLLWVDSTGRLLPWLASSYERNSDATTYTFDLRPDVHWHDGRPFTSRDVAFTFEYYRSQVLSPLTAGQPQGVAEVRTSGARVAVRLFQPMANFEKSVAASVPIVPEHIWKNVPRASEVQDPGVLVGTGPYKLDSYSPGQGLFRYLANDQFFLGRPFVKKVDFHPVADEATALVAGDLDAANLASTRPEVVEAIRSDPRLGLVQGPPSFAFLLYFNLARPGPTSNVEFRRACAFGIDRKDLVKRLTGGLGEPGNPGFLPARHPLHAPVPQYDFSPRRARALLRKARLLDETSPTVSPDNQPKTRVDLVIAEPSRPAAEVVASSLDRIGVEVKLVPRDMVGLFTTLNTGQFQMAIAPFPGPAGTSVMADPDYLRGLYSSKRLGFQAAHGFVDREFDELADRQLRALDSGERKDLLARMQRIVARELPILPLYYPSSAVGFRRDVFEDWYFTEGGFGPGLGDAFNKHVFVTGQKTGLRVRQTRD